MTKEEALQMALKFIERVNRDGWILEDFEPQMYEAITAIKEALETKDKPVSCAECGVGGGYALYCVACAEKFVVQTETKDEFAPVKMVAYNCKCGRTMKFESEHGVIAPQRTWVGLTEDQIDELEKEFIGFSVPNIYSFVQAIEAKLKDNI
jgi:hypothetical protein